MSHFTKITYIVSFRAFGLRVTVMSQLLLCASQQGKGVAQDLFRQAPQR